MAEPDFDRVAAVFTAFANSTDLYEAQQLVADEGALLFSEPTEQYVAALTARFADDPRLLAGIQSRWKLLQSCKIDGLSVAFASFFADLYSEPVSGTAVAVLLNLRQRPRTTFATGHHGGDVHVRFHGFGCESVCTVGAVSQATMR